nr:MAG TPA: hypothetical protein [Caudoviricetes sp.]
MTDRFVKVRAYTPHRSAVIVIDRPRPATLQVYRSVSRNN